MTNIDGYLINKDLEEKAIKLDFIKPNCNNKNVNGYSIIECDSKICPLKAKESYCSGCGNLDVYISPTNTLDQRTLRLINCCSLNILLQDTLQAELNKSKEVNISFKIGYGNSLFFNSPSSVYQGNDWSEEWGVIRLNSDNSYVFCRTEDSTTIKYNFGIGKSYLSEGDAVYGERLHFNITPEYAEWEDENEGLMCQRNINRT